MKPTHDDKVGPDLTPLVDLVFLLIVFFILAGSIAVDLRSERISVPPGLTGEEVPPPLPDWTRCVLEVGGDPATVLRLRFNGGRPLLMAEGEEGRVLTELRGRFDRAWDAALEDAVRDGLPQRKLVLEIRADGEVPHRAVQELIQLAADCIDPATGAPRPSRRPIVHIQYGTWNPRDGS